MANITVRDLTAYSESGSFIRNLSEDELDLQGGGLFEFIKFLKTASNKLGRVPNLSE